MLPAADNAVNGPLGFDKRNLLTARLILPERPYADAEKRRQFISNILARLQAVPAVSDASMVSNLPYSGSNASRPFYPEGVALAKRDVGRSTSAASLPATSRRWASRVIAAGRARAESPRRPASRW